MMEMHTPTNLLKQTTTQYVYAWEQRQPASVFLRQPIGHTFLDITWGEAVRQARILATYLNSLGLPPQSHIGLVSKNCAHWVIADIAILIGGHVSVPFYPTLTGPQLNEVVTHSNCRVLFVGKLDNWPSMKASMPSGIHTIAFPAYSPDAPAVDTDAVQWNDILAAYPPMSGNPLPALTDIYTIVYTSGTTGTPKGVMLTYEAMAQLIVNTSEQLTQGITNARFLSYLPLCHIAERTAVEGTAILTGGTISFVEALDTFTKNLIAAHPTHFLAVPRIWTVFQQGILAKLPQRKLDRLLRIPVVSSLVKRRIRRGIGLHDATVVLTGAAPMPSSLIQWYRRLGIHIQECYGMTENFGAVSMMPKSQVKDGTVGRVNPGMEVHIDPETSELLTRSPWNMLGYYREPALTAATLKDGWLHTGDMGEVDADGFLKITGRVNEMYKSPKGEFIIPAQLEFHFADNTAIEQICVTGQQLPQPIALVVLSAVAVHGEQSAITQHLEQTLAAINQQLHTYERIKKLVVVSGSWTVENNLMTPTMKIKRRAIDAHYGPSYESWFNRPEDIIWLTNQPVTN